VCEGQTAVDRDRNLPRKGSPRPRPSGRAGAPRPAVRGRQTCPDGSAGSPVRPTLVVSRSRPVVRDRLRSPSISSRCARTTSRRWWPANRSSRRTSSATAGPLDSADATSTTCCASTAVTTTRTGHTARCSCCRPRVVMDGFTHPTGIERETQMHADGAPASTRRRGAKENANGLHLSAGVAIKARGASQIASFGACSSGSSWFA
jgi:hypothetical protein